MTNLDYLCNKDFAKRYFGKDHFVDNKSGFSVIKHGIILPNKDTMMGGITNWAGFGGLVDEQGNHIKTLPPTQIYEPEGEIEQRPETVVYLGLFAPAWGHNITINLSRLWFLTSETFKTQFKNCPVVYSPWAGRVSGFNYIGKQKNFSRLIEILGIDTGTFQAITKPTQFENVILPNASFDAGNGFLFFTEDYRETIDRIRNFAMKNRTPGSAKKIYYFYGKHQIGEERLAEYFKSKGYAIVRPEKFTFDEQLNILINAESFASTLGSCAHNSIFLRDGAEIILIPRSSSRFTAYQQVIDQVHPSKINYIDSSLSLFGRIHGPNCFIISEQLKRFFGDDFDGFEEDDFKFFLQYAKASLNDGVKVVSSAVQYYGKCFQDFWKQLKQREDLIESCDMPKGWEIFQSALKYQTHVAVNGWSQWLEENQVSNPLNQKRDIQAIKLDSSIYKFYYSVYFNDEEGWSAEVTSPKTAGTTGQRKSITGLKIRLDETAAKKFDVVYRVHKFDGKWTPWAKNDEELFSGGVKLNAIQIKLETKRT